LQPKVVVGSEGAVSCFVELDILEYKQRTFITFPNPLLVAGMDSGIISSGYFLGNRTKQSQSFLQLLNIEVDAISKIIVRIIKSLPSS
jgi:hypothetical protein